MAEALGLEYSAFQSAAEANRSNNANRAAGGSFATTSGRFSKTEEVKPSAINQSSNKRKTVSKSQTLLNAHQLMKMIFD
ncbi:hypothetical protein O9929_21115 [Vibrio lentus]|nr:hypothetical protein [Vibrio lentus]